MATQTQVFADNASTTMAANISAGSTTVDLAPGTGTLFPNPSSQQFFMVTFTDAATQLNIEICKCTARTGDTLTIVRGQEGTTAQSWSAGDIVENRVTSGTLNNFIQAVPLQQQAGNYAADTSGDDNDLVITLSTIPVNNAALVGAPIRITKGPVANTGAMTLAVNGNTAKPIVNLDGSAIAAGALPANSTFSVIFDGTNFVLQNTTTSGVSQAQLQVQAGNYAADSSGDPNDLIATLSPAPASLTAIVGSPIRILKGGTANTGPMTLTLNGFATKNIVDGAGNPLKGNDLAAGILFTVVYNGAAFILQGLLHTAPQYFRFHDYSVSSNLQVSDLGSFVRNTGVGSITLTIPPTSTANWPQSGAWLYVSAYTSAGITIARGSGVALYLTSDASQTSANRTIATGGMAMLIRRDGGTDVWDIVNLGQVT